MKVKPPVYFRQSKTWSSLLGKQGLVELAVEVRVSSAEFESYLPYCFLLVKLSTGERIEVMGEAQTIFAPGEKVRLELRKLAQVEADSIIPYGLKAVKWGLHDFT